MDKKFLSVYLTFIFGIILFFSSCVTHRNLVYFSNLQDSTVYSQAISNQIRPQIQQGDALAIKVTTLSPDVNILFNSGAIPLNSQGTITSNIGTTATLPDGFIVDENGEIEFPILGKIKLSGLTVEQAQDKIAKMVAKTAKNPIVNIRILNFKITVIGEVSHPGIFNIPNNKVNVLEALGLAGDMTPFAIRENVLVIREEKGVRSVEHINFTDKNVLNSPFYNLHQNDIVYVKPENRLKASQANSGDFRVWSIILSSISVLSIVIIRLF